MCLENSLQFCQWEDANLNNDFIYNKTLSELDERRKKEYIASFNEYGKLKNRWQNFFSHVVYKEARNISLTQK